MNVQIVKLTDCPMISAFIILAFSALSSCSVQIFSSSLAVYDGLLSTSSSLSEEDDELDADSSTGVLGLSSLFIHPGFWLEGNRLFVIGGGTLSSSLGLLNLS